MKRKRGRPSSFDPAKADRILATVLEGQSVRSACLAVDIAASTFLGWVVADRGDLFERYKRVQVIGAKAMLDEIMEIADDASGDFIDGRPNSENIRRAAERVRVRQWLFDRLMSPQAEAGPLVLKFQPE